MFYGVLHNAKGLTANELFHFLERAIAHGDGESIVYASSKPVIMISCEPSCVLMEIKENKENCESEDVVGDEYMIYPEDHYCGYGKGRYEDE